jgi:hypothetical protein
MHSTRFLVFARVDKGYRPLMPSFLPPLAPSTSFLAARFLSVQPHPKHHSSTTERETWMGCNGLERALASHIAVCLFWRSDNQCVPVSQFDKSQTSIVFSIPRRMVAR